jgi:hypothetical protein
VSTAAVMCSRQRQTSRQLPVGCSAATMTVDAAEQ